MRPTPFSFFAGALFATLVATAACNDNKTADQRIDEAKAAANEANRDTREATAKAADKIGDAAGKTGDAIADGTKDAVGTAGEVGRDAGRTTGDAAITTAVKTALLADPDVAGLSIDVDTANGRVTLSGAVATEAQRDEAGRIARAISGVRTVDNNLKAR